MFCLQKKLIFTVGLKTWPSFHRNIITESCLLRYRRLWAPSLMTLCPTSRPASLTCWCTRTWPCGPVHLRGHSCLTTPLQSSLQKHSTHTLGLRDKMSRALDTCQHTHHHPPHNHRNLHILHSRCWSLTQRLLNQCPLRHQMSLDLHICQLRQCSPPHTLTCTVKQWTQHLPQTHLQILSGKENHYSLRCTHWQILPRWIVNQCELNQSQVDPAQTGASP